VVVGYCFFGCCFWVYFTGYSVFLGATTTGSYFFAAKFVVYVFLTSTGVTVVFGSYFLVTTSFYTYLRFLLLFCCLF
jgi:hypothetical protein